MSFLGQIQDSAISADGPITDLLRRCKVLAARLGSVEFGTWVDNELNGYPNAESLPEYRRSEVQSFGNLVGFGGSQATNFPIPPSCVDEAYRDKITTTDMMRPISHYEDLLRNKEAGTFQAHWPADLIRVTAHRVYENMNLVAAWQQIPRGMIVALIDSVRNRVLTFALEIEKLAPAAGEAEPGSVAVAPERVHHAFQTVIYGNVGNIASGNAAVSQTANVSIQQNDLAALVQALEQMGLASPDIEALREAIKQDETAGTGFAKSKKWLGKMLSKAGEGALQITVSAAGQILPKLLGEYFGLPPGAL